MTIREMKGAGKNYFWCGDFENKYNCINYARKLKYKGAGRYQILAKSNYGKRYYELWMQKRAVSK